MTDIVVDGLTIERLGAGGDGIARHDGKPVYVPFTVPRDRVRVALGAARAGGHEGRVLARLSDGPGRAVPPCPRFGTCGGCALQHLALDRYAAFKRDLVVEALARRGLCAVAVAPLVDAASPRRRVRFAMVRDGRAGRVGFRPRFGRSVVALDGCVVVEPALLALTQPLAALANELAAWTGVGEATATETTTGVDLVLHHPAELDLAARTRLAAFATTHDLARLSWQVGDGAPEPVAERRPPVVVLGGVPVTLPPGAFLQASAAAEDAIGALVLGALGSAKRVADLYAGVGTWTFRLAARARVRAVEGDAAHARALARAAAAAGLAGRVEGEARDLARRPLEGPELRRVDAVVLNPPRAGAAAVAEALARSAVPTVIAISCNPATFARDTRLLVDGGYALDAVTPVDQFRHTPHVELVGVFRR
ncbi:MAG: class I SAM-dependent RNA methyltransferase [Alphaproteobacteria bacterium]|nr:class I SAM-dependent RNA methyltransferase [Alphaproteobacteria bacterium]